MRDFDEETIAAISTPLGEGGVGIVRISGGDAVAIADRIFRPRAGAGVSRQRSHTVRYGRVVAKDASGAERMVDEALLLLMRAPKSYTREDVVEISAHGGPLILQEILELALRAGARQAAPGEFTKRAFLNGRLDLLQAEAVLDLITAKTALSRQWAASQLGGALSEKIQRLKEDLIHVLSHLEASIDFPDDFPETRSLPETAERLKKIIEELGQLLGSSQMGFVAKRGLKAVIAGKPNVGKSSLLNALAGRNRVIVTPIPGTTRDVVEEEISIRGFPVRLFDTAGIQETQALIEKEGIDRSFKEMAAADLVLYVLDGSQVWDEEDRKHLDFISPRPRFLILNKSDLGSRLRPEELARRFPQIPVVPTSCVATGGTTPLEDALYTYITQGKVAPSGEPVVNSVRQRDALLKAKEGLERAAESCRLGASPELVAADIRFSLDHFGRLVGEVVTDDVLDAVFSQFCIGK